MFETTTINYRPIKAQYGYTCPCENCGKTLKRNATVEHTVNPYNKNEAGEVRTASEVYTAAKAEAIETAQKLQDVPSLCRDCEDAPNRALLLEMAGDPEKVFPSELHTWGSPMHVLKDRGHVDHAHERCDCGSDCCSRYKNNPGFRITPLGIKRAEKLLMKVAA